MLVILVRVKNEVFGGLKNYALSLKMGNLSGWPKISYVKILQMTIHFKGFGKRYTTEN